MHNTISTILLIWVAISVPATALVGLFLAGANQKQDNTTQAELSDNVVQGVSV